MKHLVGKWSQLGRAQRRLFGEALLWVAIVRIGLWTRPFGRLSRTLERTAARRPRRTTDPVDHVVWAVRAAAARVPRATCLTQALVARFMLQRRGSPSILRIGVATDAANGFEAHAWLEFGGRIVIGEAEPGRYGALEAG